MHRSNIFKEIKSKGLSDWSHVHYGSGSKDGANIAGIGCSVEKVDQGGWGEEPIMCPVWDMFKV